MDSRTLNDKGKRPLEAESVEDVYMRAEFIESDGKGLERCRNSLNKKERELLKTKYQNIDVLMDVVVDQEAIRALVKYFDPDFRCFVLPKVDLTPTLEEYHHLLDPYPCNPNATMYTPDLSKVLTKTDKLKDDLERYFGVTNSWARDSIQVPRGRALINWDRIYQKMEEEDKKNNRKERSDKASEKRVGFLVLGLYGLILFPATKNRVDAGVVDLILSNSKKDIMHMALAETIRSCVYLKTHRRGQFRCCTQLFTLWIHGHFSVREDWKYGNIASQGLEFVKKFNKPNRKEMNRDQWEDFLSGLEIGAVTWKFPWRRGIKYYVAPSTEHNCVPLFGLYGAVSYSPSMVMMQLGNEQGVPELGGVNAWNVEYDGCTSTISAVGKMKEIWGQCPRKEKRLGEGFSKAHETWRSKWVENRVIPKKPKNTLFHQFTQTEKTLKEKEQKVADLEAHMRALDHKLWKRRMMEGELERVKREHKEACEDRDDWKNKELNAEARIESIVEGNKSHTAYLKERSQLAEELGRIIPKKNQYIRKLEAKQGKQEEGEGALKRRVEWLQRKVEDYGRQTEKDQSKIRRYETQLEQVTKERNEAKEDSEHYRVISQNDRESNEYWMARCEGAEKQLQGVQVVSELVAVIQGLRRNVQKKRVTGRSDAIKEMIGFPNAIPKDDRVRTILRSHEGLRTYVAQLMVSLRSMIHQRIPALEDPSGLWAEVEERIAGLSEDAKDAV